MSWTRYPDYYPQFICSADKCKDTCCQHWEIDIDNNTLEYFRNVEGEFGEKLMSNITYSDNCQYIKLDEHDMCPFLEEGLCSLYSRLGEEHISQICREHPRWYSWYSDGIECGMGLCCEEVAKLILDSDYKFGFIETDSEYISDDEYSEDDIDAEKFLFERRNRIFDIIKTAEKMETDSFMNILFKMGNQFQSEYNEEFLMERDEISENSDFDFSEEFFVKDRILEFIDRLLSFEIIDRRWTDYLEDLSSNIDIVLMKRKSFLGSVYTAHGNYLRLIHYFIYRYFTESFFDDDIFSKVNFALVSTCLIQLIDVLEWLENGRLTADMQVDICKIFSGEIEYDTDNQKMVSHYRFV